MPGPTVIEIPDNGGAVAVMADLHLKSYFWHGSNPLEFHGLEDRLIQQNVDALIVAGDLSDTFGPSLQDALAYRGTTRSAEPDPERVRRFVESAPPIPTHLLYAHQDRCPEARPSRTEEAELGEKDQKDHEAPR